MKAVIVQEDQSFAWQEVSAPACGANEVLLEVHYSALNRADLLQRIGKYPPPPGASEILGLECSGIIRALGESVSGWQVGDTACALLPGGGYAELAAIPSALLMPVPKGWTLAEAGAMPEAYFTAFLNLFLEASLKTGERVLIHGGASGVGTAAIQLAKDAGCTVFTTAGTPDKIALCQSLGASAINYRKQDFTEVIREQATGIDVILDMVGADYFERNLDVLATGGRLVFISTLSGVKTELDIRKLMAKRLTLKGSTLRARPLAEKVVIKEAFMSRFWPALESGHIKPVIDSVYDIREVEAAHERMQLNQNSGKIVLKLK